MQHRMSFRCHTAGVITEPKEVHLHHVQQACMTLIVPTNLIVGPNHSEKRFLQSDMSCAANTTSSHITLTSAAPTVARIPISGASSMSPACNTTWPRLMSEPTGLTSSPAFPAAYAQGCGEQMEWRVRACLALQLEHTWSLQESRCLLLHQLKQSAMMHLT